MGRRDRCDQGTRLQGCHLALAHHQAASQDSQGSAQGGLYWSLASVSCVVYSGTCRAEGLPSSHRDQQEDLQNWIGSRQGQRQDWLRSRPEGDHPNGWLPSIRSNPTRLRHAQGLRDGHAQTADHSNETSGLREDRAEVHRHLVETRSRTFPDCRGEEELHGLHEEGQDRRREARSQSRISSRLCCERTNEEQKKKSSLFF